MRHSGSRVVFAEAMRIRLEKISPLMRERQ
jgi:hypothetical protein